MKLYFAPGTCSLSPHIALLEAGVAATIERVDLMKKVTKSGVDYRTINPKGSVPALELDNGEILTEGPAIVQFIADRNPGSKLAPAAGTLARYRLQEWLSYIGTELHKSFSPLFNPATPAEVRAATVQTIKTKLAYVADRLGQGAYLMGDDFTVADGYLFVVLGWTGYVGIDLGEWPNLKSFVERVAARPQVQAAIAAERPSA